MKFLNLGDPNYYLPGFQRYLMDYKDIIIQNHSFIDTVDSLDQLQYFGDFYGLLNAMNLSPTLWWITLKINGLEASHSFNEYLPNIFIPSETYVKKRLDTYTRIFIKK